MPAPDAVFFVGRLTPGTGDVRAGMNDFGVWTWDPNFGVRLALRTGDKLQLGGRTATIHSIQSLQAVSGSTGHPRYDATTGAVDALIKFSDKTTAVASIRVPGELHIAAVSGERIGEDQIVGKFGVPASPRNGHLPVAVAKMSGGGKGTGSKQTVVYDLEDQLLVANTAATEGNGVTFGSFLDPVAGLGFGERRLIAFSAKVAGAGVGHNERVWSYSPGADTGGLRLLARSGAPAPETSAARIQKFRSLSVLPGRGTVFIAQLIRENNLVDSSSDLGCWAEDSSGNLRLIIRTGARFDGKTVRSFSIHDSVARSPGQSRSYALDDPTPTIIMRVIFTDRSESIVAVSLP